MASTCESYTRTDRKEVNKSPAPFLGQAYTTFRVGV